MKKYSLAVYGASRYPKDPEVVKCDDVSLLANPAALRKAAAFLQHCADEMEKCRDIHPDWHMHLCDWQDDWQEDMADLVVCPPAR